MQRKRRRTRHKRLRAIIRYFRKKRKAGLRALRKRKGLGYKLLPVGLGAVLLGIVLEWFLSGEAVFLRPQPEVELYRSAARMTETLDFEDYVTGVVAAEMPAAFEPEALKAQAVAARTYAYQRILEGYVYPLGANVSDDPGVCQAYVSYEEFAAAHPQDTALYYEKVRQAVQDTAGEILVMDGRPIEALYHSTCGGQTEDAKELWGEALPGIRAVECDGCRGSSYYERQTVVSEAAMARVLGVADSSSLRVTERTSVGRAKMLSVGDKSISGENFRQWLGLPSCWFSLERSGTDWVITTRGYGHGLGLCQYGAGGMAAEGAAYDEILAHYYRGAKLCRVE